MFFDARRAKQLAPGEHLLVDGCQGLRLVATESTRTWVYRYKVGDKMKQARLGHWPAVSVQAAAAQWQAMRDAREKGEDPKAMVRRKFAEPKHTPSAYTTRELVGDYITGHLNGNRTEASAIAATRALKKLLDDDSELANMAASEVTRARAFAVIETRKDYPTAAAKLKSLLAAAWDYANDSGRIEAVNWWRQVQRGRLKSKGRIVGGEHVGKTRRVLTLDEVRTLLAWAQDNMHETGRDVLTLYLWTCTRGSEIVSMRPEHISDERGQWWWTIPASLTKNAGNPHSVDLRVPLFGRALEVVQRRMDAGMFDGYTQHFFSTYVYDLQPYSIKSQDRPHRATLPVTNWTPHDLRRTSRTLLAGLGCPNEIAEAILGHMPPNIVATYNRHSYDAERVMWLRALSDLLES